MENLTKMFKRLSQGFGDKTSLTSESDISMIETLPEEILEEIFILVPADVLCKTTLLVCKRWHDIIERDIFWIEKGIRDKKLNTQIVKKLETKGIFAAKKFYFNGIFNRNLLKNPFGDQGFDHWIAPLDNSQFDNIDKKIEGIIKSSRTENSITKKVNNRSFMKIEKPPKGLNNQILDKNEVPYGAFVTSYQKGERYQVIDFQDEFLIEQLAPEIEVKENYTERFDCGCKYGLRVYLVSSDYLIRDKFVFEDTLPQWGDAKWKEAKFTFKVAYPVRYLIFYHFGNDTQFWAGEYGSKMTNGSVKIIL